MSEHNGGKKELKKAAALKYDAAVDEAPTIVGVGAGLVAENIIKQGMEHDVPIVEDRETASILQKMNLGDSIPPELYQVIAEILVFVAKLDEDQGSRYNIPY